MLNRFALATPLIGLTAIVGIATTQPTEQKIDAPALRAMIVNLGYDVKDISTEAGKEKYEFMVKAEGYDVYLGAEISPSKSYIWLTAFLGKESDKTKYKELCKTNSKSQPTMFYVTDKGNVMAAIAVENRNATPAWLKRNIEKVSGDVSTYSSAWTVSE